MARRDGPGRGLGVRFGPVDGPTLKAARRVANQLGPREGTAGFVLAAYSAVAFIAIRGAGDITSVQLGVGLALAAALVAVVRSDHRLVVGIAAAAIGGFGPWKMWGLFALPLLIFTTYLLVKARGAQERELRRAREVASGPRFMDVSVDDESGGDRDGADMDDGEPRPLSRRQQKPHPRSKKKQKRRR